MVQMRVDGTRKNPLAVVDLSPSRSLPLHRDRDDSLPRRSALESHMQRVNSRSYWALVVITYALLTVLCLCVTWMSADAVRPMIDWPYNASVAFLNSTDVIYIYGDNSLGRFMAPLLTRRLSPVPAWSSIMIQGTSIQIMIVCVFLYEAVVAIGRLSIYKRRSTVTLQAQKMFDLFFSFLGGLNVAIAFFTTIFLICSILFLQVDSTSGYQTTQVFMSSVAKNDVSLIETRYHCVLEAGMNATTVNETTVMASTTESEQDGYDDYGYWEYAGPVDCAAILYLDIAYVVKVKMLLMIFTAVITLILAPILARGDHRLAVEMRTNPVFKQA